MNAILNLNVPKCAQICAKALNGLCVEYDGFEPAKKCVTNFGAICNNNKPKTCGRCGNFHKSKCSVGYSTKSFSRACRQATNKNLLYRSL
jgi:hypothetical protein